jgi:predicted dehydrogenase
MTSEPRIKCAVIGAGWWGVTAHIPAIKEHPRGELVAVQKRDRDAAGRVARDFDIPFACSTVEEVLAIDGLEAVIVSSTPNMHYRQARAALEEGCHVLIEKPMTITVAQAEELVQLADSRGLQFLISCPWHYTQHNVEARRLLQSGRLGPIKMVSILMTNFTEGLYRGLPWEEAIEDAQADESGPQPYLKPGLESYCDPAVAGGGQIYCQVSHAAAHLAFITGSEPTEVFARFDNCGTNVDIYNVLNIKLDDGAMVSLASTGATMPSERTYEVRVYGTEGMLFMDLWKGTMVLHKIGGQVQKHPELAPQDIYPLYAPATNLVDVILGLAENGSPATLGATAMRTIEAACKSASCGRNAIV